MKKLPIGIIELLLILSIALVAIAAMAIPFATQEQVSFTVSGKERVVTGQGDSISSKYLVFSDTETFKNSDCFVLLKFNSSDIYGRIEKGKTYNAKVYGFRIPFLSMYRNIISVSEAQSNPTP